MNPSHPASALPAGTPAGSRARSLGFGAVVVLSLAIAGYAVVVYAFLPIGALLHPAMRATYEAQRVAVYLHVFAALLALLIGPLQFSSRLRAVQPLVHRWLGRIYLGGGVLVGGLAGLYMAFHAFGGPLAQTGFGALALAWLWTGWMAWRAIRAGDRTGHRRWMLRNFALTFAAVTLRLWLPLALGTGIPFEAAYPVVAWLCWVPNLLVAQRLAR